MDRNCLHMGEESFFNKIPNKKFTKISDLRDVMNDHNPSGSAFLEYLISSDYFDGKSVWVNNKLDTKLIYNDIIDSNPHLQSESPYGEFFNKSKIRLQGENEILISNISSAPEEFQEKTKQYEIGLLNKTIRPTVLFSGGPSAKISTILSLISSSKEKQLDVRFCFDGGEQSNESASASYEHINHANALNAEHDNTGLGILLLALKRAIFGEKNPDVAIKTDYHKVDLWPNGIHIKDIPIYIYNELHGRVQYIKRILGFQNDHDKSRLASKISTEILTYIENKTNSSLRLPRDDPRAIFLYYTKEQHEASLREYKILSKSVGIYPRKLTRDELVNFYGEETCRNITSADIFYENYCIRHGFDNVCGEIIKNLNGVFRKRLLIKELYFDTDISDLSSCRSKCIGARMQNQIDGTEEFLPLSYVGLSLGPTATYKFNSANSAINRIKKSLGFAAPVPHQTIATGLSAQLLFKIIDKDKFKRLPYTGLKQTHFVEIGRTDDYILIKLTSGGVIGQPVYSRSYGISAISNMLRILTPDTGLQFIDVACAWPGARGVNGPNNGQIVRLADNAALRFGEGGTGMSKMGTNAQTILDMIGVKHSLPKEITLDYNLYSHTIIDKRKLVFKRLAPIAKKNKNIKNSDILHVDKSTQVADNSTSNI